MADDLIMGKSNLKVKGLNIKDFGFIGKLNLEFDSDNVNVVFGKNGSGKTTVLAIIYSMFQEHEVLNFKANNKDAVIQISVEDNDELYHIKKRYHNGSSNIEIKDFQEMKYLSNLNREKIFLLGSDSMRDKFWLSDERIKSAVDYYSTLNIKDNIVETVLLEILLNNKSFRFMSIGQQLYFGILSVLSYLPVESVLLIDGLFSQLDTVMIENIMRLMNEITNIQFIVTAVPSQISQIRMTDCKIIELNPERNSFDYINPLFSYKQFFEYEIQNKLFANKNDLILSKPIVKYKLGIDIEEIENRNIEFKEIKGNNPCNTIIDISEIYINAFLNSWVTGIGTILWGVSDCGIVVGVELTKNDKDKIVRKLAERVGQMRPYVSQDSVQIIFENIVDNEQVVSGLYVVEVIIAPYQIQDLVSTSKDEVYIKTEGGKRKLNSYEIQQELKKRNNLF